MIIHNEPSFNRLANFDQTDECSSNKHRMIIVFSLQSSYKEDIVISWLQKLLRLENMKSHKNYNTFHSQPFARAT